MNSGDTMTPERNVSKLGSFDAGYPLIMPGAHTKDENDPTLAWLTSRYPEMETWRDLGHRWLSSLAHEMQLEYERRPPKAGRAASTILQRLTRTFIPGLRTFLGDYLCARNADGCFEFDLWRRDPKALLHCNSEALRDHFWQRCCKPFEKSVTSKRRMGVSYTYLANHIGATYSQSVELFLTWVVRIYCKGDQEFRNPFLARNNYGTLIQAGPARLQDAALLWVSNEFPELEKWRPYAVDWIASINKTQSARLGALSVFIGTFLADCAAGQGKIPAEVAADPIKFLWAGNGVGKDFWKDAVRSQNHDFVVEFLDWILLNHFSEADDMDRPRIAPGYKNPFAKAGSSGHRLTESPRSAMPFGYLERARSILVQGHNFCDWKWAQEAQQFKLGHSADWFEVPEELIDKSDPDCVWRVRTVGDAQRTTRTFVELWSPVRWVALLLKLNLALRTMQVRVLDSGETDTLKFDYRRMRDPGNSPWVPNEMNPALRAHVELAEETSVPIAGRRAKGGNIRPSEYSNGVFRRIVEWASNGDNTEAQVENTVLYVNTNKTADAKKEGAARGFEVPWPISPYPLVDDDAPPEFETPHDRRRWLSDIAQNVHYWLWKLRNWQSKYNAVDRRTPWKELDAAGIIQKRGDEMLSMYRPATFLFREPARKGDRHGVQAHLPVTDGVVTGAWASLVMELQDQLAKDGQKHLDGTPVLLMDGATPIFDLHSLRVSVITLLAIEGKIDYGLLMKIVGHSRLVMTLYYTKPTIQQQQAQLTQALTQLDRISAQSEIDFLKTASFAEAKMALAFNDEESALIAIGDAAVERNLAGWLELMYGYCPAGGNTSSTVEQGNMPGCHNGGKVVMPASGKRAAKHGPVEGGARNCPNCRWFITGPSFLHSLQAKWNNSNYWTVEAREKVRGIDIRLNELRDEIYDLEHAGARHDQLVDLRKECNNLERQIEGAMKQYANHALTMANTDRLIRRCLEIARARPRDGGGVVSGTALVLNGGESEWRAVLSETAVDDELLQLCGVSEDAEIYPDLDAGKAIIRRSQILDRKLMGDGFQPIFLQLTEDDQKIAGNALMRRLATLANPADQLLGRIGAAKMLQSDVPLHVALGMRKDEIQAMVMGAHTITAPLRFMPRGKSGALGML